MSERTLKADVGMIRRALDLLVVPGGVIEIRTLKIPGRGKPFTSAGYFDDLDAAATAAAQQDARNAAGVYLVLNEINPALLARSPNTTKDYIEPTTCDGDIVRRRWLGLDFDPRRPAGISSTEEEHCAALDLARECAEWSTSLGWPAPIVSDSGNGAHLLYHIDLPNDEAAAVLVKNVLISVAAKFSVDDVDVDLTVFNAARIWKLYGTVARKGHDMPDRPHRLAQVLDLPDSVNVVSLKLLEALVATVPVPETPMYAAEHNGQGEPFRSRLDVPKWLNARGLSFKVKDRPDQYGRTVFLLEECPFDSAHGGSNEVAIFQDRDGKPAAACKHNSCQGRGWQQFKEKIGKPDPDHWDPPLTQDRNGKADSGSAKTFRVDAVCIRADTIKPRQIRWLWPNHFARGKYNEVIGQPGLGKSLLLVDLAARETRGLPFPDEVSPHEPGDVVLLSAEDDPEDTTVPRLIAAGADLTRVRT